MPASQVQLTGLGSFAEHLAAQPGASQPDSLSADAPRLRMRWVWTSTHRFC